MANTILVVDDDEDVRETIVEVLKDRGFDATGEHNGEAALNRLKAGFRPCLILLDLTMPVMDGSRFREEQLKTSELANIPVLLLSAHGGVDGTARALGLPFLPKPPDLEGLLKAVAAHCGDPSAEEMTGSVRRGSGEPSTGSG